MAPVLTAIDWGVVISDSVDLGASRTKAELARFRSVAAILARAVGRVRRAADVSPDGTPVSENSGDSLPERLEIAGEPPLSVSHEVSDRAGGDQSSIEPRHGETN